MRGVTHEAMLNKECPQKALQIADHTLVPTQGTPLFMQSNELRRGVASGGSH